jgi:glyoxylase-like metal-dependent hydrolase (beta-lactamase superfamily II)
VTQICDAFVLSVLIELSSSMSSRVQDFDVLPTAFSNGSVKAITPRLSDRGQLKNVLLDLFNVNSIEEVGLTGIFLSHAHVDHYGNLLDFPNAVPVFVGSGTLGWIGGGEDAAKRGEAGHLYFPSSFLKDRVFIEMHDVESKADDVVKARVRQTKVGPFDRAWDWFGDGSVVIASAEGHCHGHIVLLARTSPGPRPSYVLLSGDAAHQQALYHPLPPPLELDGELLSGPGDVTSSYSTTYGAEHDQRATPGFFDSQSSEAITDRLVPDGEATCMQEFPDKAMRTIAALSRMEACADVMVILYVSLRLPDLPEVSIDDDANTYLSLPDALRTQTVLTRSSSQNRSVSEKARESLSMAGGRRDTRRARLRQANARENSWNRCSLS